MSRYMNWRVFALLLSALALGAPAQAQVDEAAILNIMEKHDAVGLSVVVVKDGSIKYSKAFGIKDVGSNTPLNEDDLFRIASISKSFSSTALMRLVERKKVSLDDDFSGLVGFRVRNPAYPDKVITLRMVLSHTSSINDSQGYFNLDVINPDKNPDWAKCYNSYVPGDGYQYCNLNFNMAGAVIERLTNERFDVHIRKNILNPLKLYGDYCVDSLNSSSFVTLYTYDSTGLSPSPAAYAPRREELASYVMGYSTPIFSPTGGMKMSAPGLARYMMMHMNGGEAGEVRIIRRKSSRRMQKPVAKKEGYGLALITTDSLITGRTMVGHTGSAYGLYSAMFFDPKEKFGFVVITNGCRPSFEGGMNTLLKETINNLYSQVVSK